MNDVRFAVLDPLNTSRITQLREKLAEYKKRREYLAPEVSQDTWYKETILEQLLKEGSVDSYELWDAIAGISWTDQSDFHEAFKVIRDYASTGGENCLKGDKRARLGD